jgi:hypothetical protein
MTDCDDCADRHATQQALPQHAEHGDHRDDEFTAITAPEMPERGQTEQARHRHQYDSRQHRLGQRAQQLREEKHHHQNEYRRDGAGQRRSRAPALVDDGLRHAAADRETLAEPRSEVRRAERQKFLVGVQPPVVLGRERAADGGRLNRCQQEACDGQGQHRVQVFPTNRRKAEVRQPLRHFAEQLHPALLQPEKARSHDARHHDQ